MSDNLNIEVVMSPALKKAIEKIETLSGQTAELIAQDALKHYVAWRVPQLLDLQQAIAAADNDEFASDDEVEGWFARHGV
jgi:predicted transcriptional regulator